MHLNKVIFLLIVMFTWGCSGIKKLEASEYLKWCAKETSSFTVSDTIQEVCYSIKHISSEEDAANCLRTSCLSVEEIKAELLRNKSSQQFSMRIRVLKTGKDIFDYTTSKNNFPSSDRQKYFAFEMKKDVKMITKMGDTLDCSFWSYEPSMAGSGIATILFGFQAIDQENVKSICINDRVFTGEKMDISLLSIPFTSYPTLKIK